MKNSSALKFAAASFISFALAEIVAAFASNSLSLFGDAVTMIIDSLTYFLNMRAEALKATESLSARRKIQLEIVSPLLSVIVLCIVSIYMIHSAYMELNGSEQEEEVNETIMFTFSLINLLIDIGNIFFFSQASSIFGYIVYTADGSANSNINMCSAYTHVIADTLRSIAVLGASLLSSIDPSISSQKADSYGAIAVSVFILLSTLPLFIAIRVKSKEMYTFSNVTEPLLTAEVEESPVS